MRMQQQLTILVFYNTDDLGGEVAPPSRWNWTELTGESVSVVDFDEPRMRLGEAIIQALKNANGQPLTIRDLTHARLELQGYDRNHGGYGATAAHALTLCGQGPDGIVREPRIEFIQGPPKAFRWVEDAPTAEPRRLIDPSKITHMQRVDPITHEPIGPRIPLKKED